jgi:hypothetical protein
MRLLAPGVAGLVLIVTLGAMNWGCGSRSGTRVAPPSPPAASEAGPAASTVDCALVTDPGEPITTVAVSDGIDPANAPHPSNDSERLLFRQLYETLVRVDCEGRVRSGLAASWEPGEDEGTWVVTLREGARFSDGTPVTSADVVSSWTRGVPAGDLRAHVADYVRSIVVVDDRTLIIGLHGSRAAAPRVLAVDGLAIARRAPGSAWPLGTRSVRVVPGQVTPRSDSRSVITLAGVAQQSTTLDADAHAWSLRVFVAPDRDPRDFLDQGVDLLLTMDPATLDYAATLPQFQIVPLAWQRTHVFLSPWRSRSARPLLEETRDALALDAVRGDARGARGPFWWETWQDCELAIPQPRDRETSVTTGRIVYERDDRTSRDLAERFVALAHIAGTGTLRPGGGEATALLDALPPSQALPRAVGLTRETLPLAHERGTDAAYIMALPRDPFDRCQELRALVSRLGWLDPDTIVPLVETRAHAIVRRGRSGSTVEWNGGLIIAGVGPEAGDSHDGTAMRLLPPPGDRGAEPLGPLSGSKREFGTRSVAIQLGEPRAASVPEPYSGPSRAQRGQRYWLVPPAGDARAMRI